MFLAGGYLRKQERIVSPLYQIFVETHYLFSMRDVTFAVSMIRAPAPADFEANLYRLNLPPARGRAGISTTLYPVRHR